MISAMLIPRLLLPLALIATESANAWCPAPVPKACSAFFDNDKVFYGKVVKATPLRHDGKEASGEDSIETHRYTIEVEQALKGKVEAVETVDTENASNRWIADVGEARVVFARNGRTWGLCSPIDEARHASQTIREIRALPKARQGTIEGMVVGPNGSPAAGVKVVVAGAGRSYDAITDKGGTFSVAVKPGRYRMASPGLEPTVPYGRQDVAEFEVAPGQCAQFQLSKVSPK
jgi:carboxypeptidase family protein